MALSSSSGQNVTAAPLTTCPLGTNMVLGDWPDTWRSSEASVAIELTDITPDPNLHKVTNPGMTLARGLYVEISMVPDGGTEHPDQHGPVKDFPGSQESLA